MRFSELQTELDYRQLVNDDAALSSPDISAIEYDSREVGRGALFVCIDGFSFDGHDFAQQAVENGAAALCVSRVVETNPRVPQIVVDDTRIALARLGNVFYHDPSSRLKVVGITGTNGKTTTTYILDAILRAAGHKTAVFGTVETRIDGVSTVASRTTQESVRLQGLFSTCLERDIECVAMEVSSHAIDLRRVDDVTFAVVAFTNLTQDHLDYHVTMDNYLAAKRRLFTDFRTGARVIDIDSPVGEKLAEELGETYDIVTVGRQEGATLRAIDERPQAHGTIFTLCMPGADYQISLPLSGAYNVDNALVAAGCAFALGISEDIIVSALNAAPQVPGRLERVICSQPFEVVVDYAHTPDSLEKALCAMRAVTEGKLIVVFGCGGDRDAGKRPLMGKVAGYYSDLAIATSDNPRTEDPVAILLQVIDGLKETGADYIVEVDRRHAIERACILAKPKDCVLIAGKGHEDYQIFAHHTVHFDDREVARESLGKLGYYLDEE